MTKSTSELERDAERTRAELSSTLDEIRGRMEPGRIMDRAFSYARVNGGTDFVKNAAVQARENPLPVLLIGAGLAWLISGRKPVAGPSLGDLHSAGLRTAHDAQGAASSASSAVGDAMSSASAGAREAFSSGKAGVHNAGAAMGAFASSAGDTLKSGGEQIRGAAGDLQRFCAENPIAVGAVALAVGAAIGAAFPNTDAENRLMGSQADDLKATAKAKAEEGLERGERAVKAGLEEAKRPSDDIATS